MEGHEKESHDLALLRNLQVNREIERNEKRIDKLEQLLEYCAKDGKDLYVRVSILETQQFQLRTDVDETKTMGRLTRDTVIKASAIVGFIIIALTLWSHLAK